MSWELTWVLTSAYGYHVPAIMISFPNILHNAQGCMNYECQESFYIDGLIVLATGVARIENICLHSSWGLAGAIKEPLTKSSFED